MGRELRRKQAKKEGKSLQREMPTEQNEIKNLLIITLILVVILSVIYLLSALFVTKELDWFDKGTNKNETNTLIDNTILASETFKQKEEVYYVYFYNYNEEDAEITTKINDVLSEKKVYKVDTGTALNKKYVSETSNKKAKKIEDLKVKAPTLVKIDGEKITTYYEGNEIIEKLK